MLVRLLPILLLECSVFADAPICHYFISLLCPRFSSLSKRIHFSLMFPSKHWHYAKYFWTNVLLKSSKHFNIFAFSLILLKRFAHYFSKFEVSLESLIVYHFDSVSDFSMNMQNLPQTIVTLAVGQQDNASVLNEERRGQITIVTFLSLYSPLFVTPTCGWLS